MVVVSLPDWMKPATPLEASATCTMGTTRGKIVLRVSQRFRMNVGGPNDRQSSLVEGIGDAHSSDDTRKGKSGSSEGALL
jgi:hypothetical protein